MFLLSLINYHHLATLNMPNIFILFLWSERKEIYRIGKKVQKEVGDVTILVNNAGVVIGKSFLECPDEEIENSFQVNTLAYFWVSCTTCFISFFPFVFWLSVLNCLLIICSHIIMDVRDVFQLATLHNLLTISPAFCHEKRWQKGRLERFL